MHQFPAQLPAPRSGGHDNSADGALAVADTWWQAALVSQQRIALATDHVEGSPVQSVQVLVGTVLFDHEDRLSQRQDVVERVRIQLGEGLDGPVWSAVHA